MHHRQTCPGEAQARLAVARAFAGVAEQLHQRGEALALRRDGGASRRYVDAPVRADMLRNCGELSGGTAPDDR